MEFKAVDKFPHNQIIAQSKISSSDLDDNLKTVITSFNRKHNGYKMKPTEATEKELMALSTLISQHIYDYYVDKEDQEIVIQQPIITPKEVKEIVKEIENGELKIENEGKPEPIIEPVPTPEPKPEPVIPIPPAAAPEPVSPIPAVEEEPTNKNEKALFLLLKEGVSSGITKRMLSEKGFNIDLASIRGCKVGKYRLHKEFSDTTYNLEKI